MKRNHGSPVPHFNNPRQNNWIEIGNKIKWDVISRSDYRLLETVQNDNSFLVPPPTAAACSYRVHLEDSPCLVNVKYLNLYAPYLYQFVLFLTDYQDTTDNIKPGLFSQTSKNWSRSTQLLSTANSQQTTPNSRKHGLNVLSTTNAHAMLRCYAILEDKRKQCLCGIIRIVLYWLQSSFAEVYTLNMSRNDLCCNSAKSLL